jgi:hypothetical protein
VLSYANRYMISKSALINLSEWEPLSPDVSEEKLDRRAKSKERRYMTAEVLAHLEKQ